MIRELKELKEKEMKEISSPINEMEKALQSTVKLLEYESAEDARIIRHLSNNSVEAKVENLKGRKMEIESLEARYEGDIFTLEQIKQIAVDYRLRFLKSEFYTGSFDPLVAVKLRNFAKSQNMDLTEGALKTFFYILAPAEMFQLKKEKYVTKAQIRAQNDPAIFYKISDTHYKLIHKWGSDLTPFRYLMGFKWKRVRNQILFNGALGTLATTPIYGFLDPVGFIEHPIWYMLLAFGVSTFVLWLIFGKTDEGSQINKFFTPHNFNSETKIEA